MSGITPNEFDNHTLAVLKGRLVRYLMRSRQVNNISYDHVFWGGKNWFSYPGVNYTKIVIFQITVGRSTKDYSVDVDLTLEGPAWKVSRQQATIRLRNNGDFFLMSEGKRPVYVDGKPILPGNKYRLNDNSVVEVCIQFFQVILVFSLSIC